LYIIIIIIIIKNEKIRVTLCENAAGALYIVIVNTLYNIFAGFAFLNEIISAKNV